MSEATSIASGGKIVGDAAALSLIDIRRIDRAAEKTAKRGDLTAKLKRRPNGELSTSTTTVVPSPSAVPAPPPIPPAPELPAAAFAPELPPPAVARSAVALPEPYVVPEPTSAPVLRRAVALPEPYVAPEPPAASEAPPSMAAAIEAPRAAPLPYDDLRGTDDLIYYWDELRGGRELPFFSSLDRTRIAISWPDTVMVNYGADDAAMPQIARLSRLTGVVEFTSMVTEWILSCSRQVARIGKAMETKRAFSGANSPHNYHMLLLPFANPGGASDHVLCHLSCAD